MLQNAADFRKARLSVDERPRRPGGAQVARLGHRRRGDGNFDHRRIPTETLFAVALPLLGEGIDLLANGLEAFLAPPLIAALALSAMIRDA